MIRFTVETVAAVASTNDLVADRARDGAAEGLVIRAEAQTSGRGRQGRHWESPRGNLYASLLLRPRRPLNEAASLSLVIALSLAETLGRLPPPATLSPGLKWPNDVRLAGAKTAGILLENAGADVADPAIVAGLGVNVAAAPADMPYPVTALHAQGAVVTPENLLDCFLEQFAADYGEWQQAGFAALRNRWLSHADGLGEPAMLDRGDAVITGRFVDVDPAGHLVLETADGVVTIPAGELQLGSA